MNAFQQLFETKRFPLIVSLPRHGVEWAMAAQDNGADAIKVHSSFTQPAPISATFGSLEEEAHTFEAMRKVLTIPMGIVPGEGVDLERQQISRMVELGMDYCNVIISAITPLILEERRLTTLLAIPFQRARQAAHVLERLPGVVAVSIAHADPDPFGMRPSLRQFIGFKVAASLIDRPLVISTASLLRPEQVPLMMAMGAGSLMIGGVVTGNTVEGVGRVTRAFRDAIDSAII